MNLKNIILEGLLMVCFPAMLWAQEAKIRSEKMEELFKMLRPADRKILVEGFREKTAGGERFSGNDCSGSGRAVFIPGVQSSMVGVWSDDMAGG